MADHIHKNEIIAWANGKTIEFWDEGFWYVDKSPSWHPKHHYRVQPESTTPVKEFKKLKHHELSGLVNELRDTCKTHCHLGMLREKLLEVVCKHIGHLVEPRPDGTRIR